MDNFLSETEIRRAVEVLKPNGRLFEVRIKLQGKKTLSGYFTSADILADAFNRNINLQGASVFFTLNGIESGCYSREQRDRFVLSPQNTTSDNDITGYDWLLIDLDPTRPTGVSSSDDELAKAYKLSGEIKKFLKVRGFSDPLVAMSGNGIHLLYKVAFKNTENNTLLVKNFLQALDITFSTEEVKVDTTNYNPARICKLYGTMAQKGSSTAERPHRMSRILSKADTYKETPKAYVEKLVKDILPKEQKPEAYNSYRPQSFDIEAWMQEHGIRYRPAKSFGEYSKYILEECPFDSNHKAPDSMITVGNNGKIGFRCLHNSCQGRTWQDVRIKYEPKAYDWKNEQSDDSWIDAGWKNHKANRNQKINVIDIEEQPVETKDRPMFLTARQILEKPTETEAFISTGIDGIDNRMRGLKKGCLSVVSGMRGGSKSTWLSQVILEALNTGNNVICYSGELTSKNFMKWMNLQAAGKNYTVQTRYTNYYAVPDDIQLRIADWMGEHFLLYDNEYGNKYSYIRSNLEKKIIAHKTDLVVLDNLMSLNIRDLNPKDKYDAQTVFVNSLSDLAKRTNTHIIFVAHPRKNVGLLRLQDVSGTADLANMVDNAFIVHRVNEDFKNASKLTFKWPDDHIAYSGTNVIEIAKDRDGGNQDVFIPLWYEKESKRLKNSEAEMRSYGWEGATDPEHWQDQNEEEVPF